MSNLFKGISKKYLPIKLKVSKKYFEESKSELSEEEFNKRFSYSKDVEGYVTNYYELTETFEDKPELMMYMLYELLEQQKTATKKLNIISGIVIFWLICDLITAIVLLVTLL